MKAVKATGLVPVRSIKTGDVFGVKPAVARAGIKDGSLELRPEKPGIVYVTIGDVAIGDVVEPKPKESKIEIPEGWEDMHDLERIKLAHRICGSNGEKFEPQGNKLTAADDVILNELVKREGGGTASRNDEQVEDKDLEDIPADYATRHPNKNIALAKRISGREVEPSDGEGRSVIALRIIEEELQRRAAAGEPVVE